MASSHSPANRHAGGMLLLLMAILVFLFLLIAFWGSRSGTTPTVAPVRNSEKSQ